MTLLDIKWKKTYILQFSLLAIVLLWSCPALYSQEVAPSNLPPGKGKDLLLVACTQCHGLNPTLLMRDGRKGWKDRVENMILRGSQLLPQESEVLIDYLAENLGPGARPPQSAAPGSSAAAGGTLSLPPGPGKDLVEASCSICHDLARVVSLGRSREEWVSVTEDMVERGLPLTAEEIQAIVSYLTANYGKEAAR